MATNWANILVQVLLGRRLKDQEGFQKAETVNVSGKSTWVEQVSWTPLTKNIGIIRFKPDKGRWYTVPNQTYDNFLQLIKDSLTPGSGTGTQIWRLGFLRGLGRVRQRSDAAGKFIAGFEQKKAARDLANAFRRGNKQGKEALAEYVAKFSPKALPFAVRLLTGLSSALIAARMLA